MPDGLLLVCAGLLCCAVFVALVSREERGGWLVLTLGVLCIAGGLLLLAGQVFSG